MAELPASPPEEGAIFQPALGDAAWMESRNEEAQLGNTTPRTKLKKRAKAKVRPKPKAKPDGEAAGDGKDSPVQLSEAGAVALSIESDDDGKPRAVAETVGGMKMAEVVKLHRKQDSRHKGGTLGTFARYRGIIPATISINAMLLFIMFQSLVYNKSTEGSFYAPIDENPNLGPRSPALYHLGGLDSGAIRNKGEIHRVFWAMLMHGGWVHVGYNTLCQVNFMLIMEPLWGFWRTVTLFWASGVTGNLVSSVADPCTLTVGSSGALFGLISAMFVHFLESWHLLRFKVVLISIMAVVAVITALIGFISAGTDNWAHLGGFLGGFLFALATTKTLHACDKEKPESMMRRSEKRKRAVEEARARRLEAVGERKRQNEEKKNQAIEMARQEAVLEAEGGGAPKVPPGRASIFKDRVEEVEEAKPKSDEEGEESQPPSVQQSIHPGEEVDLEEFHTRPEEERIEREKKEEEERKKAKRERALLRKKELRKEADKRKIRTRLEMLEKKQRRTAENIHEVEVDGEKKYLALMRGRQYCLLYDPPVSYSCHWREWLVRSLSFAALMVIWIICFVYLLDKNLYVDGVDPPGALTFAGNADCMCCYDNVNQTDPARGWTCHQAATPVSVGTTLSTWVKWCEYEKSTR
eukprot:GHVU01226585.1.p1 GENE.GHVU01226585.1~~GHVU01226585.1.p1  ORF type:complete len:638 (+),score=143.31 GHVU01226585.1:398-2311(+)